MSDILKSLFGGSSSQQNTQATSTPTNFTNPGLSGLAPDLSSFLNTVMTSFGRQAGNAGNPIGSATPTTQAGVSGQEGNLLSTINSQVGPGTDSAKYIKDVLSGSYLPGSPNQNPYLAAAITAAQRPTLDNLTQTLTQALPGRFAAAGQSIQPNSPGSTGGGSSAFDNAAALAFQSAANTSTDIASNIGSDAYKSERQNQNVAAGLDQAEVDNTIKALQASALPRLIQQNGLDQGLALFQEQTKQLLDILKTIGAVQAPTLANTSQSTGNATSSTEKGIVPGLFPNGFSGKTGG